MAKVSYPDIDKKFEKMTREIDKKMTGTGTGLKKQSVKKPVKKGEKK